MRKDWKDYDVKPYDTELSHEIRTSLNSICGNLNILQMEEAYQGNRYLENAVLAAEYLLRLVNSALNISTIENRKDIAKLEAVTLEKFVQYPKRILELEAAKKKIRLQFLVEKPVYKYLYLNIEAVWQIIINLISNAIKYTDDGGEVLCHITENYLEEKRVKLFIEVKDTGIGMEQEFLSAVWEDYTREERKKETGGSGLGMALTKRLVELLHGNIEIRSEVGVGTTVCVNLEADADDVCYESLTASAHMSLHSLQSPSLAGKKISVKRALVAEDEEGNMEIMCRYLHELGIAADKAYDGRKVIELFGQSRENYYDVILMDMNMPDMNGAEAVLAIRGMDRKDRNLPIIAVTADLTVQEEYDVLSDEVNACLKKPYCLEDVRYTLLNC